MKTRRSKIAAGSVVILLLVGIGVFLAYDMNAPVQQVRVYELPDSNPITQNMPITQNTNRPVQPSVEREALLQKWRELKARAAAKEKKIAENRKKIAELEATLAELKAAKAKRQAIIDEVESLHNWVIEEWGPRAEAIGGEVGFLLPLIEAGMTQQDFMDMFPDLEERDYYATKLIELSEVREELVSKMANTSEPIRKEIIKALRNVSSSVLTDEDIDALISDIRAKG